MRNSHILSSSFCFVLALATVSAGSNCPDGWKFFQRPSRGVCLKLFTGGGNCLGVCTNANVESKCRDMGGALAGYQNQDEINWFTQELPRLKGIESYIWVGAKRIPNTDEFRWTDPYIDGKGFFNFYLINGKPKWGPETGRDCAYHRNGQTLPIDCNRTTSTYVCVKPAN